MKPTLPLLLLSIASLAVKADPALIDEHVYGGLPSSGHILHRTAYIQDWDAEKKAPRWVAYRLNADYRRTPPRDGRWQSYRGDRSIQGEARSSDYSGAFNDEIRNYARGHLAPYMISGGDRDNDGILADTNRDSDGEDPEDDPDERETVYQINYYTNLTPQHHDAFNGSGGVWFEIEERVRELQDLHDDVWVFAGPIWGPSEYDNIGNDVPVAPMFFQIVIWEDDIGDPVWEAYMTAHHQANHGDIREQMVSVRHIESMSGLNFFPDLALGDAERDSTYDGLN